MRPQLAITAAPQALNKLGQTRELSYTSGKFNVKCKCPFHSLGSERTPSFHFSEEEGRFYCFGCGKFGDSFDLLTALGVDGKEALYDYLQGASTIYVEKKPDIRPFLIKNVSELTVKLRKQLEQSYGSNEFDSVSQRVNSIYRKIDEMYQESETLSLAQIKGFFLQMNMELENK